MPFFRGLELTNRYQGVRYKAAVIWDLFWTPFDERFSEILSRMKRHRTEFDSGLRNVYSEEILRHFSAMDQEREDNAKHRLQFADQWEIVGSKAIGMSTNKFLDRHEPSKLTGETDEKLLRLQTWISAPNWTTLFEVAKGKRMEKSGRWLLDDQRYQDWLTQTVPFPSRGSIFAKNVLVLSGT